jgi:hypothetical protein
MFLQKEMSLQKELPFKGGVTSEGHVPSEGDVPSEGASFQRRCLIRRSFLLKDPLAFFDIKIQHDL